MKRKYILNLAFLFLIAGFLLSGCNIFGWVHKDTEPADRIATGQKYLNDGDFVKAQAEFEEAMKADPNNADARYLHAKAVIHGSDFSIVDLVNQLSQSASKPQGMSLPIFSPTDISPQGLAEDRQVKNEMYQVNRIIYDDIRPIYEHKAFGSITADDVEADLALATALRGILGLRDTNQDGKIDENDFVLNITSITSLAQGKSYDVKGLEQFLQNYTGGLPPGFQIPISKIVGSKGYQYSPRMINPLINSVLEFLKQSEELLIPLIQQMLTSNLEGGPATELSVDQIRAFIAQIKDTLPKYRYFDRYDNDRDGRIDEEQINSIDDDHDGLVDEDTDRWPGDPNPNPEPPPSAKIVLSWNHR